MFKTSPFLNEFTILQEHKIQILEVEDMRRTVCMHTRKTIGETTQNFPQSKAMVHSSPYCSILADILRFTCLRKWRSALIDMLQMSGDFKKSSLYFILVGIY